jgi:thiol:disulfide interchange protein DsbD
MSVVPYFSSAKSENKDPLQISAKIVPAAVDPRQIVELQIDLTLPEGYKAYEDQFKLKVVSPKDSRVAAFRINPVTEFYDKFSKRNRTGVIKEARMTAPIEMPSSFTKSEDELILSLTYQACTDTYCLFPISREVKIPYVIKSMASATLAEDEPLLNLSFEQVFQKGLGLTFLFVFVFGILTSFTPCIFPMIPITLAVLGKQAHARSRWQNIIVAHLYVFGVATTYALLGVVAALTGSLFGSFMSHPLVLGLMCFIFLAMALSMFGLFNLEAPAKVQSWLGSSRMSGYSGAFFTGIFAGIVASPCVGPVLVAVLTYVAQSQNVFLGFSLLFVYALGLGQLFILLGISSQLTKMLPKSGPWMEGVKHFFATLMLGAFFYYFDLLVHDRIWDATLGIALVVLGSVFGSFFVAPDKIYWVQLRKAVMQAMIIVGSAFILVSLFNLRPLFEGKFAGTSVSSEKLRWEVYREDIYAKALAENKNIVIDFWAEWCAACFELEEKTFIDSRVQERLNNYVLLKFDATSSSQELDRLKKKYAIRGLPTLIFYSQGKIRTDQTLTEFERPESFLERLNRVESQ